MPLPGTSPTMESTHLQGNTDMEHTLPPCLCHRRPGPTAARKPLEYRHHGKHHQAYVVNLNNLQREPSLKTCRWKRSSRSPAAASTTTQRKSGTTPSSGTAWPQRRRQASGALADAINAKWGSYAAFKKAFVKSAVGNFGSGWTWLVKKADGSVDIVNTWRRWHALTTEDKALLTVDVWEHAYYIDYRNLRPKFVETFLNNLVNWKFAEASFA